MHLCMLSCPYNHDQELLHSNAKDDQELLHSNAEDGTCISQCLTSMHATTCVSITPPLLANHVPLFSTPLIQASNAHVLYTFVCCTMHTSMCNTRPFVVYTTDTSYERQWATDAMCPVHHWCNVRASVCYTCRCVVYITYKQPTSDDVRVLVSRVNH